jgi:predicted O-methyltransferase YrrM
MRSFLHFCRFLIGVDSPDSQVTASELELLCKYARNVETVCEIGCFEGSTTAALAKATAGTVYTVDAFFRGRLGICYGELIAHLHCRRRSAANVRFIRGFSEDVASSFNLPIDFLFIDADHRYEAVKADWQSWVCKLRRQGIVALHDCKSTPNVPHPRGSRRFYEIDVPTFANFKELESVDSLVILQVQ